jgi:hypothetical protein
LRVPSNLQLDEKYFGRRAVFYIIGHTYVIELGAYLMGCATFNLGCGLAYLLRMWYMWLGVAGI